MRLFQTDSKVSRSYIFFSFRLAEKGKIRRPKAMVLVHRLIKTTRVFGDVSGDDGDGKEQLQEQTATAGRRRSSLTLVGGVTRIWGKAKRKKKITTFLCVPFSRAVLQRRLPVFEWFKGGSRVFFLVIINECFPSFSLYSLSLTLSLPQLF